MSDIFFEGEGYMKKQRLVFKVKYSWKVLFGILGPFTP